MGVGGGWEEYTQVFIFYCSVSSIADSFSCSVLFSCFLLFVWLKFFSLMTITSRRVYGLTVSLYNVCVWKYVLKIEEIAGSQH